MAAIHRRAPIVGEAGGLMQEKCLITVLSEEFFGVFRSELVPFCMIR
jgi:hypothetical protein